MQRDGQTQGARLLASLIGLSFLVTSALFARTAAAHMGAIGHICGGAAPHCLACHAAVASALAALLAFAITLRPQARALRIRARR